ncbi:hypothetical protein [Phascolarctobacterium faecium]|uniref:hypothetical protein n=1 Tax=Phascolarctobacterium faecium TaxID=33025 RepID=UPI0027B8FC16|nr:hypothetical protein [Phascolarctobacterium faecium]
MQRKFQSLPIGERCPSNPLFNDQDRYFRIHGNFGADDYGGSGMGAQALSLADNTQFISFIPQYFEQCKKLC